MVVNNYVLRDLYTDYLLASTCQTSSTGLSALTGNQVSHDKITRLLRDGDFNSEAIWRASKPIVREIESGNGCVVIDDSVEAKPYTDENELICWHYDHTENKSVKGVNFITALYAHRGAHIPLGVEFIKKSRKVKDPVTGKEKRVSDKTKNELYRQLLEQVERNNVKYQYVLNDTWYSSSENMQFVKKQLKKEFIMALKSNRKVALSKADKEHGKYVRIEALELKQDAVQEVYLEQIDFPVLLIKQCFKNEDGSIGILYLVTSDLNLTYSQITTIYQTRWKVEEFHKSVKSNASFSKSPGKTVQTQLSHFYASILAYIKMEWLKFKTGCNHFALKGKIYLSALHAAFMELQKLLTTGYKIPMPI